MAPSATPIGGGIVAPGKGVVYFGRDGVWLSGVEVRRFPFNPSREEIVLSLRIENPAPAHVDMLFHPGSELRVVTSDEFMSLAEGGGIRWLLTNIDAQAPYTGMLFLHLTLELIGVDDPSDEDYGQNYEYETYINGP